MSVITVLLWVGMLFMLVGCFFSTIYGLECISAGFLETSELTECTDDYPAEVLCSAVSCGVCTDSELREAVDCGNLSAEHLPMILQQLESDQLFSRLIDEALSKNTI